MRPEAYTTLAERQKTYWWHRARRALALSLLTRYGLQPSCGWLDIGCGPGGNLNLLDSLHPNLVAGIDLSPVALELAAKNAPMATLVASDINLEFPFLDATFDVATIFNVLYHQWVKSERAVLAHVARVLRPGGLLLLTEPAFDFLRRELDETVMTRRRYQIGDFDQWLRHAGFEPLVGSYFTSFIVPVILAAKARRGLSPDTRPIPAFANELLYKAAVLEGKAIARGARLPFGTTLILLARRS
jgi:SAM-dependent methyltransferase